MLYSARLGSLSTSEGGHLRCIEPHASIFSCAFWLATAAVIDGCTAVENDLMPLKTVTEVLEQHSSEIMAQPGVVGVGESECAGAPCIRVYVLERTPDLLDQIPATLEGYPVLIEESAEIRPLDR